jgi:malonate-semialdehyde dehydrogenase (acetylating)/methylmalonate-semialdehyde dehydrogenase
MAVSMVVAVGGVADELVEAIKQRIPKVKVGAGLEPARRWARSSPVSTGTASRPTSRTPRRGGDGRRRYDEAVRLVNESPYGNGTALFTRGGGVARQFQFDVKAGTVGINVPIPAPVAYYSFRRLEAESLR